MEFKYNFCFRYSLIWSKTIISTIAFIFNDCCSVSLSLWIYKVMRHGSTFDLHLNWTYTLHSRLYFLHILTKPIYYNSKMIKSHCFKYTISATSLGPYWYWNYITMIYLIAGSHQFNIIACASLFAVICLLQW